MHHLQHVAVRAAGVGVKVHGLERPVITCFLMDNWPFSYNRMAFYIRGSQETETFASPVSVVVIDPEEMSQTLVLSRFELRT